MPALVFASEEQRLFDPLVSLIPKAVWDDVFSKRLDDIELDLIKASSQDLRILLTEAPYVSLSDSTIIHRCFIALLFCKPLDSLTFNNLMQKRRHSSIFEAAFMLASKNDHLAVIERLIALSSETVEKIMVENGHTVILNVTSNGHLSLMERLMELVPQSVQDMYGFRYYFGAFITAATKGDLLVINRLMSLPPHIVQDLLFEDDYSGFAVAAAQGHLPIIERFIDFVPDEVQNMVEADEYRGFRAAAKKGHLPVIERIMELAPEMVHDMIEACEYQAFSNAAAQGHMRVINRLLLFPSVLAYAEMHEEEYHEAYIYPFIQTELTMLREAVAVFEREQHVNGVFDINDADKTQLYFYIMRNLIRRNNETLLDALRFLLSIPAVKAFAHMAVTLNQPNELIRLALTVGNEDAADILLNIPAVRELAEENNFYRAEPQRGIDLAQLAQDRESSMCALSTDEQRRLKRAIELYQPLMKQVGVANIMNDLRETLVSRYNDHPVFLRLDNEEIIKLPLDWVSFNQLELNEEERAQGLRGYYQNKDHTAWRYLSKPNLWMSPNASYVYVNPNQPAERWSTFEEFQPLISMLYLAATDKNMSATEGWTLDTRIEHFIDELAHIGRAHNWDDTREQTNLQGEVYREEYDNLQEDKPSCFSGVNRRLFQSVMGHPLLTFLTLDGVKQALREFMREHFKQLIVQQGPDDLRKAWVSLCKTGVSLPVLDALNLSLEQQEAFLNQLEQEYKTEFTDYPRLKKYVQDSFLITPVYPSHVVRFAGETGFGGLLPQATDTCIDEAVLKSEKKTPDELEAKLALLGELGECLNALLYCLTEASTSTWAAWSGAAEKVDDIKGALNRMPELSEERLRETLQNKSSELSTALYKKPTADNVFRYKIEDALQSTAPRVLR